MVMQMLASVAFSGAAAAAGGAIYASVAPQWRRIIRLAAGNPEMSFAPLSRLVQAEQRIAIRRRAVASRPAQDLRAAA